MRKHFCTTVTTKLYSLKTHKTVHQKTWTFLYVKLKKIKAKNSLKIPLTILKLWAHLTHVGYVSVRKITSSNLILGASENMDPLPLLYAVRHFRTRVYKHTGSFKFRRFLDVLRFIFVKLDGPQTLD